MELSGVFQLDAITDHKALELFRTATKTAIKNMKKIDLLRLVALHVQKTSLMSAEKMSVAELRHLIQNEVRMI
jgi:hypothetical protein